MSQKAQTKDRTKHSQISERLKYSFGATGVALLLIYSIGKVLSGAIHLSGVSGFLVILASYGIGIILVYVTDFRAWFSNQKAAFKVKVIYCLILFLGITVMFNSFSKHGVEQLIKVLSI